MKRNEWKTIVSKAEQRPDVSRRSAKLSLIKCWKRKKKNMNKWKWKWISALFYSEMLHDLIPVSPCYFYRYLIEIKKFSFHFFFLFFYYDFFFHVTQNWYKKNKYFCGERNEKWFRNGYKNRFPTWPYDAWFYFFYFLYIFVVCNM